MLNSYKIMISRIIYEHACEPDKDGKMSVLSRVDILNPGEVCTDSYLVIAPFETEQEALQMQAYLKSKFARFLIAQTLSSINLSKEKFSLVPMVSCPADNIDEYLYKLFSLSNEEIDFVESFIHEMPQESADE